MLVSAVLALSVAGPPTDGLTVLVTGATGGTGRLLYSYLKADSRIKAVRALVYGSGSGSPEAHQHAAEALNCSACDSTEGIFYGDVSVPASLTTAFEGIDSVAITVGAPPGSNTSQQKSIEFIGVENQAKALVANGAAGKHVTLCSSMATTNPKPLPFMGGPILFWKLNAEAFLGASGIPSAIIKPCGIEGRYGRGGKQLLVGHDDELAVRGAISREDVAAVMAEAVALRSSPLRFDLCIGSGPATTDLPALLDEAFYPWQE